MSNALHHLVVCAEGRGTYIESADYRHVYVSEPSVETAAWIYIPRMDAPSVPAGGTGIGSADDE